MPLAFLSSMFGSFFIDFVTTYCRMPNSPVSSFTTVLCYNYFRLELEKQTCIYTTYPATTGLTDNMTVIYSPLTYPSYVQEICVFYVRQVESKGKHVNESKSTHLSRSGTCARSASSSRSSSASGTTNSLSLGLVQTCRTPHTPHQQVSSNT